MMDSTKINVSFGALRAACRSRTVLTTNDRAEVSRRNTFGRSAYHHSRIATDFGLDAERLIAQVCNSVSSPPCFYTVQAILQCRLSCVRPETHQQQAKTLPMRRLSAVAQ